MPSLHYRSGKGRYPHYFGRRWDLGLCGQRSKRVAESQYVTSPKCLPLMKERGIPIEEWKPPPGILLPDTTSSLS